ncbi:DUF4307 domain-containing protein [Desertivibrio insolitus]|uniref:DUF4307 domain-containing protein n=1 Tax=Herbiconiux sp. SYSU D00978 TaxID=2812562 RepID=UPI001F62201C|nr:DUF4307 domain-containing protein [Herbiconiux sp. SYSU D00978]
MTQSGLDLDARYGRTGASSRRGLWVGVAVASVALVLGLLWLVFVAFSGDNTQLQSTDIGHEIVDENTVTVDWGVTAPANAEVSCALQALNADHGVVGWKIVELPASSDRVRQFSETLTTTEPAVNGLIYRCWLS